MNNNLLIQENFNESVEVNNPYIPGLNSLESDEIAKHSGSYSVPPLNDFNQSTSLSNDRSLIEIENQITDGNTISSNNYDFLTGTNGSSPLLNVGKDFDLNPDLSTVDINSNRLDTSTSALRSSDSLGEGFNRSSNTILTTPQPTDLSQLSTADANDSDAVVSSPISDRDSSFDGENSGQVTIEALEKNTEIPSNSDIETIDSNLKSDVGTDEEVYQNKQKEYDSIDDDGHHKEHEKEHHGHHKEHDKEHEKDGEGREIEIDSLKKAIAFLKKNDIFNLPKKISEVEIEVETGKKGLNKLLKISQFKDILAKAGLPAGAAELKKLLKGNNEREIEREIKLPNGSTISVKFEAEEGKIGFSLEVEKLLSFVPPPPPLPLPLPLPLPPTSTLDPLITLPPGISASDFTVDQINVLNNPLSQVRRNIRFLRKDQNGCFSGEIDKHLGGPTGSGYATFTTGSKVDFLVFAPNGESVFYDGLIRQGGELFKRFGVPTFPPSRSVAEAKNITDWLNPSKYPPFLRNIELQRQRAEINRGLRVGAQCLYNLSYVAADQNLVNDINQIFPNRSQLPTYFIP